MGEFRRPPEERSSAAGLLLTDATLAKVPLTVLSLAVMNINHGQVIR